MLYILHMYLKSFCVFSVRIICDKEKNRMLIFYTKIFSPYFCVEMLKQTATNAQLIILKYREEFDISTIFYFFSDLRMKFYAELENNCSQLQESVAELVTVYTWSFIDALYFSMTVTTTIGELLIIIMIIIIKKDWHCKAGRGRLTPYQFEDPSHTLPTYRGKEEKGK